MPPKFWRSKGKGKDTGKQQPITNFVVASPSKPAPARPADETAEAPPAAKRQRTARSSHGAGASEASGSELREAPSDGDELPAPSTDAASSREAAQQRLLGGAVPPAGPYGRAGAGGAPIEPPVLSGEPGLPAFKLTPLELQVVALKQQHPDVCLCVEVGYKGKFFGRDALTVSRVLGFHTWQDRNFLTCWVPMERLEPHIRRLAQAGHKVGVVRQVESAAIKKAGDNKAGPFERRLTALHTRATLEAGELGGLYEESGEAGAEWEGSSGSAGRSRGRGTGVAPGASNYLVCCVEEPAGVGSRAGTHGVSIGLAAVEPSTGAVLYAQFSDGLMRQELESRLMFAAPAELLLAEPASAETRRLLSHIGEQLGAAPRLETAPASTYSREGSALAALEAFYGAEEEGSSAAGGSSGSASALAAVRALPPLVLCALAHLRDYLRPFGLESVLQLGGTFQEWTTAQEMRLSANTLRQLEVFANSADGTAKGSLLAVLDHTQTSFGRRMLRSWVGKPLRHRASILKRLDAVQELAEQGASHPVLSQLRPALKKLPDLERGLTRAFHATSRPSDFAALLQQLVALPQQLGLSADLQAAPAAPAAVASCGEDGGEGQGAAQPPVDAQGVESPLLRQLLQAAADPSLAAAARQMLAALDLDAAASNDKVNVLRPSDRFPEVQRRRAELAAGEKALRDLLPAYRRQLNISNLQFVSLHNVGDYLLEVPMDLASRAPKDWPKVNATKKFVRYRPPEVAAGLQRVEVAKEHLTATCHAAWRQYLADFAGSYLPFRSAVQALAALDCLCSLAEVASSPGYCRPVLAEEHEAPQLEIKGGRHPVVELLLERSGQQYMPNDTCLRGDGQRCQIITGPNMGGKSCYTRQCALIAIMAQLGSYVPAAQVRLRALDGVFTRMGASDNLALGRSTFAEELGETSAILSSATPASLVILDELGRGTSTGDGAAIAEATLAYLVDRTRPLTLFVTHYPEVCFRLQAALPDAVGCYRMAHVEEEGEATLAAPAEAAEEPQQAPGASAAEGSGSGASPSSFGSPAQQQQAQHAQHALGHIVFLFKLVPGVAPASYGLNVARMAQLPERVLRTAAGVAAQVQAAAEARRHADSGGVELEAAAQACRQFVQLSLSSGGPVDVAAGRELQQRVRRLLAA